MRTYPVTLWAGVGVFAYAWKASLVATTYRNIYWQHEQARQKELAEVK